MQAVFVVASMNLFAQTGSIKGRVFDNINNNPIGFASIVTDSSGIGVNSDIEGNYKIENLKPGSYNVICKFIGFRKKIIYEVIVRNNKTTELDIPMEADIENLDEVVIRPSGFNRVEESPTSLRSISATEIYRNPGGNRDISKVIQILPGVSSTVSFRNDLIVRGGAANENRFYLDGIEVPNINHFATQGFSGGPVGMINVNFIREVDFYSGAFPLNRGNALSSVIEFKQINGNDEKLRGSFMLGSSDAGITLDGPLGKKSAFILSARRSYLQYLFKVLALPFLPTYNDFQYKQVIKINTKNQVSIIGLGAIDDFKLNKSVNDGLSDDELINRNNYFLNNLPVNTQWNYAAGINWKHFSSNSYQTVVFSRNQLSNKSTKYKENIEIPANLLLDYTSQEIENKFRLESTGRKENWKWTIGTGFENALYTNSTYNKKEIIGAVKDINFNSRLTLNKFSLFAQLSRSFFHERLSLSAGLRTDFNSYSNEMSNPVDQLAPSISGSFGLSKKININFNAERYYQLPAYTVMGYRDSSMKLANKTNKLTYIRADHLVAGLEINPTQYLKITLEGFYKWYSNYPFLLNDSISLANLGGDFGVIGNEAVVSTSKGESKGIEFYAQQKLTRSIYGILSYTYYRSQFRDKEGKLISSAWDNRHLLSITAGKKFPRNWEAGLKFRLLGGAPYTPYDVFLSSRKVVWDVTQQGIFDWGKLNSQRNPASHGLDLRVDKKWFFKKWTLNTYLDIQNVYNFQAKSQAYLDVRRDSAGNPLVSTTNPDEYQTYEIENTSGNVLPSVGVMVEF